MCKSKRPAPPPAPTPPPVTPPPPVITTKQVNPASASYDGDANRNKSTGSIKESMRRGRKKLRIPLITTDGGETGTGVQI
tara:strand:- start:2683 stop:2922 length:240 start_codon:yes stop_codon:yes gene_type:complete